ncbi:MAG TPA: hypothetical protein VLF63_03155, partial [Patescibacteria group bacterium]|nr:hypothetical protein [Patescibacteria group bacterium]
MFRKIIALLIAILIIVNLLMLTFNTEFTLLVKHKGQIDSWINKKSIYSVLIKKIDIQANEAVRSNLIVNKLSIFANTNINSIFPENQFNNYVSEIINSNYSWLEGKTAKPLFSINLINLKQQFASNVASYIKTNLQNLPLCSELQLIELENNGPQIVNCLPPTVSPNNFSNSIKNQILNSDLFSNEKYITADSIIIKNFGNNVPYYKKLNKVPKYYQKSKTIEYVLIISALILSLLLFFVYPTKLTILKFFGWIFLISGLLLLLIDPLVNREVSVLFQKINNNISLHDYKNPLSSFIYSFK